MGGCGGMMVTVYVWGVGGNGCRGECVGVGEWMCVWVCVCVCKCVCVCVSVCVSVCNSDTTNIQQSKTLQQAVSSNSSGLQERPMGHPWT